MFEFKVAFKYLLFRKSRISSSLISLISTFIISIVVWLVLVFLSVTNGIEKNWLVKLTSLNAPIRIAPTNKYYSSYYYLIDNYASSSDYSTKNIKEKLFSKSDPYDPCTDMELPYYFPKKENMDPVKKLYSVLETLKQKEQITFQDYELSAAMMRLTLTRSKMDPFSQFEEKINFLTQMTYLTSLTENNPNLEPLLLNPSNKDINQLIYQTAKFCENIQNDIPTLSLIKDMSLQKNLTDLLCNFSIEKIQLNKNFLINLDLFKSFYTAKARALIQNDQASSVFLTNKKASSKYFTDGKIYKEKDKYYFKTKNKKYQISNVYLEDNEILDAKLDLTNINDIRSLKDLHLNIKGSIQNNPLSGRIPLYAAKINKVKINENQKNNYFYSFDKNKKIVLPAKDNISGVLLPKNYKSSGVLIGDNGYLSYTSMTINSNQEMRIPIFIAGFYDPGVLPIGNKCIIVPSQITKTINSSINNNYYYDGTPINGIYVWIKDLKKAELFKQNIQDKLEKENIASFFEVSTYKDFEFSKDLMQQFQSDRTLFTIIAIIILMAACSNIISMLVLLVNDKKKEIAILRAMGASSKSIALIFGFAGFTMGLISSIIGITSAIFTLKHLDVIIKILSALQGHNFFNTNFFGSKLPNDLSIDALFFVIIITPILSLIAGIIPAIKASRLHSSSILRQ